MKHIIGFCVALVFALACPFRPVSAGPAEALKAYADLLKTVAQTDGVRWDLVGPAQKEELKTFLAYASEVRSADQPSREAQLAFWINAYNACVMKLILDHMPIQDVMKLPGFRDRLQCSVAGQDRTLVDIESGVIGPLFSEPRAHFALWWGIKGGPRLAAVPYEGKALNRMLEDQTKAFVIDPVNVEFSSTPTGLTLSPLFGWYKSDFGKTEEGVLAFIRKRLPKEKSAMIPKNLARVKFAALDWTLDQTNLKH
ncbi:MAG: DUF547 domain-containing protein [Pseudomonadota bacterium]